MLDRPSVRGWLVASVALFALALSACGGGAATESTPAAVSDDAGSGASTGTSVDSPSATATAMGVASDGADVVYAFPTGPAVTVPEGYVHPTDAVANTGAYLPTNGKPTLVFVDAIW